MRFRLRPLTVLVISIPTAVMGVLSACGGGETTPGDGGSDATVDAMADVTPDVAQEAAPADGGCDAPDLSSLIPPADASIDVDAGGVNFGPCLSCLESPSGCGTALQACNGDCFCRQGIIDFGTCLAQTQDLQTCGLAAISTNNTNLITLLGCAQQKCLQTCAGTAGDGGASDSGPTDSGGGG